MGKRGPLPKPAGARTPAESQPIQSSTIPAAGRTGRTPRLPAGVSLGERGQKMWREVWKYPAATRWHWSDAPTVARLCQLREWWEDKRDAGEEPSASFAKAILDLEASLGLNPMGRQRHRTDIVDESTSERKAGDIVVLNVGA